MILPRIGRIALLALALAAPRAIAQQPPQPVITGAQAGYDIPTRESVVSGGARAVLGDLVITAEEIRYNAATNEITASGNFVLSDRDRRVLADRGTYNVGTGRIHCTNIRLGRFPVYVSGDTAEGTVDELTLTNATIFFRDNAAYSPSIRAKRLTYSRGRVVVADDVHLGIAGAHFVRLPHIEHSLSADFISRVTARVGYRRNLGASLEAGLNLPVARGVDVGAMAGIFTERGLMFGPTGEYERVTADSYAFGHFTSGYINDHGNKRTDVLGRPVPEDRGFFEWQHRQRVGDRFSLNGQFNYWRDSEILRDFRPKSFTPVQQPDSYLEAAYAGDNFVLSAFARFHPNHFHRVQERLPEVRLDLLPSPLPGGFYQRFEASAAVLEEDPFLNDAARRSNRLDTYYGLSRPMRPAPWFTFTPVAGGRITYYADTDGGRDHFRREIGEFGFDARLLASGTFDYRNEIWEIDGLRHLIEPVLSYRYAPRAGEGRAFIPAIDRRSFATYLQPLSIADTRNIDDLQRLDTLRLQFNNSLQTRDAGYGSRELASLNVAADYWFTRANNGAGRKGLSDLHAELSLTPAPWLKLHVYNRVDARDSFLGELNTALELVDQDWWSVKLATHFLKNDYEEYSLEYAQQLNEVFGLVGKWRYDARRSRLNEQTYGFTHRLGQTWSIKYEMSFFEGRRRESSFAFNVEVDLLKF